MPAPHILNKKIKKAHKTGFNLQQLVDKFLFNIADQQSFLEDLATLVEDGVPANKAVLVIEKVETGAKKRVARNIMEAISQGKPIADGLKGWFSQATVELIRAGEQGGTLGPNLQAAASALGMKSDTLMSLVTSLTYPLVVIIAGCVILIYLNHSIFSQFASIKPISEWPEQGQKLVSLANFLQIWWWLVVVGIVGTIVGVTYVLKNYVGEYRSYIDKLYGTSLYRKLTAARFMETLGLLISNGIVFKQALKILQHQASPYLAWHLIMMEFRLGRGRSNIAEVLDTGLVAHEDVLRLRAIADAKGFEHALVRLGKFAASNATKTIRKLGKILGGILLTIAALLAGFMVSGMYSVGSSLS